MSRLAAVVVVAAGAAHAFGGFVVAKAGAAPKPLSTHVVVGRAGSTTVLTIRHELSGVRDDFALVIPVPGLVDLSRARVLSPGVLDDLERLTAPRLVEYWEADPCPEGGTGTYGIGSATGAVSGPTGLAEYALAPVPGGASVGEALEAQGFLVGPPLLQELASLSDAGFRFVIATVTAKKLTLVRGVATLTPLRIEFTSDAARLSAHTLREDPSDAVVHVISPEGRFDVMGAPAVPAPTNVDLVLGTRGRFPSVYSALVRRAFERSPAILEFAGKALTVCDGCTRSWPLSTVHLRELGFDAFPEPAPYVAPRLETRNLGALQPETRVALAAQLERLQAESKREWTEQARGGGLTVTRLRFRPSGTSGPAFVTLGAAAPVTGGRERSAEDGRLESVRVGAAENAFETRFAVRHPWRGAAACDAPEWGVWFGAKDVAIPASIVDSAPGPALRAPITSVDALLASPIPQLGLGAGRPPAARSPHARK